MSDDRHWGFHLRGFIGGAVYIPAGLLVLFSRPIIERGVLADALMTVAAWILFGAYVTVRLWAMLYVGGQKDRVLQTEGPYSIVRNPLYFGSFCFALSVPFFFESLSLALATLLALSLYFFWVIRSEEDRLKGIFGDEYRAYLMSTPRLLPNPLLYRASRDTLEVPLGPIRVETRRLWRAMLLPILSGLVAYLRSSPSWPHYFTLP